jgi:hypothetical protein
MLILIVVVMFIVQLLQRIPLLVLHILLKALPILQKIIRNRIKKHIPSRKKEVKENYS